MIYNYISTKAVIAKIMRDLDIQEENTRITDFIEWVGEGLKKIGAIKSLNVKVAGKEDIPLLRLEDYQVQLPNDLFRLLGVAYSNNPTGPFIPMRYGTGTYDSRGEENTNSTTTTIAASSDIITLAMDLYDLTYEEALELVNNDPILESKLNGLLLDDCGVTIQQQTNTTLDYTYVVNSSYLKTNIKEGYIMLAYAAISIDEEGYPLIPDDPSYIEALYWYVNMKTLYSRLYRGEQGVRYLYEHAESKWRFYRKQAYAVTMMPNTDQHESLKNQTLKLYPEIDSFNNFFSTLGEQQVIYNHTLR